jgi:TatA/E family protein of Tat protein translocase
MGIESPVHLLFIAVVALVVLGPKRLPGLARALGQGIREFRQSLDDGASAPEPHAAPAQTVAPAASASSATPTPAPDAPAAVSSAPAVPPPAPSPPPGERAAGRDATGD